MTCYFVVWVESNLTHSLLGNSISDSRAVYLVHGRVWVHILWLIVSAQLNKFVKHLLLLLHVVSFFGIISCWAVVLSDLSSRIKIGLKLSTEWFLLLVIFIFWLWVVHKTLNGGGNLFALTCSKPFYIFGQCRNYFRLSDLHETSTDKFCVSLYRCVVDRLRLRSRVFHFIVVANLFEAHLVTVVLPLPNFVETELGSHQSRHCSYLTSFDF